MSGAGAAGATDSWDSFAGGLSGGIIGAQVGNGILSSSQDTISNKNPVEGDMAGTDAFENDNWRMLGICTTDAKAQLAANEHGASVFYTRSRGPLADFVRAGIQKFSSNSLASGNFASQYLRYANNGTIYAHSEGTLTLAGAIKHLNVDAIKLNNIHIKWNGPVITRSLSQSLANSIGATSNYKLNLFDPIGALRSPNPIDFGIYGGLGIATFTIFHGTKYYAN